MRYGEKIRIETHLRSEGVYDLGGQRFGELQEKDDGKLKPGKRSSLFVLLLRAQQGSFLVNLVGGHSRNADQKR